uniref:Androgen-dependent TFPI-regulating protein-like n=1 Tax=Parastrongyloides trichosuri TaxID=131310 RepID=A0A0N4Z644_PARTI
MLRFIIHLALAGWYGYILYFDSELTKDFMPIKNNYFSKFIWLTHINLCMQFLYHSFATAMSTLPSLRHSCRKKFDFFATALIFPVAATIVFLFWGLTFIDPGALADPQAQKILAIAFFNHSIHTLPLPAMLIDFILWKHNRPNKSKTLKLLFVFSLLYIIEIFYVNSVSGIWPYPILGELSPPLRILFILVCMFVLFLAFLVGDLFNYMIGGVKEYDAIYNTHQQPPQNNFPNYGTLINPPEEGYRVVYA